MINSILSSDIWILVLSMLSKLAQEKFSIEKSVKSHTFGQDFIKKCEIHI